MYIGKPDSEIGQEFVDAYTAETQQPNADLVPGSVNKDIIDATAIQVAEAYDALEEARKTSSLKNAASISTDALSQIALNWDVLRTAATFATGTVTLQRRAAPTVAITVPRGTLIRTQPLADGSVITYTTDADATLPVTATLNRLTNFYEVDVDVTAQTAGTASHVGVNALTEMPNRTAGIDAVTNKEAINNAADEDDNDTLAAAIREKTAGVQLGTAVGYQALILDEFEDEVVAVEIVGPYEADNLRVQYGNEIDVSIVATTVATSFTTILTCNGSGEADFQFGSTDYRPVQAITSVTGLTNGTNYTPSQYGFDQDTGVVFGYSSRSFDALCWFPNQDPGLGIKVTVQGTYNAVVRRVQDFLDDPIRKYITGDLLVKEAQEILVDITLTASAKSGVDRTALASAIRTAITEALEEYAPGDDVYEDDIIDLVQAVDGVNFVEVPLTTLKKSTASSGVGTITVRKQEYARAGTITVTVS